LNRSVAALYRTYRPQRFDDVVGQDAVVRTLKNAIASGRIAPVLRHSRGASRIQR
jgi:DNA polymerase III gamma/tau subunit